jgi:tetratricopeptide (TPR) repeat protein
MAREPISPHLRQWNAWFHLFSVGRATEAKQQMDRVVEEDPLSQMWRYTMSVTLAGSGRDDEALREIRKAVELDPQFWLGWSFQGLLHALHGRHAESLTCAEKAIGSAAWSPYAIGVMAAALTNMDRTVDAEPLLATLRGDPSVGPLGLVCYYVARGDVDSAVEWSEKAADQRIACLATMLIRAFEPRLNKSAGWPALLKKLNLKPAMN